MSIDDTNSPNGDSKKYGPPEIDFYDLHECDPQKDFTGLKPGDNTVEGNPKNIIGEILDKGDSVVIPVSPVGQPSKDKNDVKAEVTKFKEEFCKRTGAIPYANYIRDYIKRRAERKAKVENAQENDKDSKEDRV